MKRLKLKIIAIITAMSVICSLNSVSLAHLGHSINGIISWSSVTGWELHHKGHMHEVTYRIVGNSYMTQDIVNAIEAGAASWAPTISITRSTSSNLMRVVSFNNSIPSDDIVAQAVLHSVIDGHVMQFTISLNPNRISYIDSSTMAHEFGHVIGLDEVGKPETGNSTLVNNLNVYNIMYYSEARVAKTPTVRDRGGARVATGQHSTHTFFTMSHPSKGAVQPNGIARNNHRNACADCRGLQFGTPISSCITFNANGTCALCHTHRGGDVDRNGIYNIADVLEIQKYLAKMNSMINSWETYYLADANGDGSVTIDDALAILKLL